MALLPPRSRPHTLTAPSLLCSQEVAILKRLAGHENIVRLHGVYEDDRHIHIVMELCRSASDSSLPPSRSLSFTKDQSITRKY